MKTGCMFRGAGIAMKITTKTLLLWVAVFFCGFAVADDLAVDKLDFAALPGNQMEIRLDFTGVPPAPTGYQIEKPARIALDIVGAKSRLESKHHNLGTGNARSMTVVEARDRIRVIINLNELVGYNTRVEGNTLVVTIGDQAQSQAEAVAAVAPVTDGAVAANDNNAAGQSGLKATVKGRGIDGIDFRRTPDGEGQVVVSMSSAAIPVDVRLDGGRIIAEFMSATLPESLRRKLDVTDFATAVTSIVTSTSGDNIVMVIQPKGQFDFLAYQADKEMIIGVKTVGAGDAQKRQKDNFMYSGEKLSLNFQDIEVRSVLQLIADFTSLNLVASDTVSGRITLRLQNVPWDQALDLVLKTKGLDKRQIGNVLLVAPADEISARERLELEAYQQAEALAPLRSEFVQINYATATEVAKLLTSDKSILSSRGSVSVDERTNTLIIVETSSKLEDIREVIARLDIPVRQVLIEARIVLATTSFAKELGVRWGVVGLSGVGKKNGSVVTGGLEQATVAATDLLNGSTGTTVTIPDALVADMGVSTSGASRFSLGMINLDSGLLEMELSALASDGHGEIVATPKVLTTDKQEALIASGTQIPYFEASSSGATSTSFKDAELRLRVKPQITPDGKVIMNLKVNSDSVGEITSTNIPVINTNRVETVVLVNDGDTVVLGGIFKTESVNATIKTPFLGDLPFIGRLFRKDVRTDEKAELLIFITPKIVKDLASQG
ncbi:MAG: type IV pilus secretin PilQ [Pseudomonadota bacterium]